MSGTSTYSKSSWLDKLMAKGCPCRHSPEQRGIPEAKALAHMTESICQLFLGQQICTWPKLGVEAAPKAGVEPPPKPPKAPPELAPKLRPKEGAMDAGAVEAPKPGVLSAPNPPGSIATSVQAKTEILDHNGHNAAAAPVQRLQEHQSVRDMFFLSCKKLRKRQHL